jgi:GH25 family lysozyme M1 (1,4-beta-N-acetylmuramidase)
MVDNTLQFGVDVSAYQAGMDFDKVVAGHEALGPCKYAIVKTTQDNLGENKLFLDQAIGFLQRGVLVGTYHFAGPQGTDAASIKADAIAEAQRAMMYRDKIQQKWGSPIYLPSFLDLERNKPLSADENKMWSAWANYFREEMEANSVPFGVYGGQSFLAGLAFADDWKYVVLWQAQYWLKHDPNYISPYPNAPNPWGGKNWSFWQCGGGAAWGMGNEARWPGIPSYADVNLYRGTMEELKTQFGVPQ